VVRGDAVMVVVQRCRGAGAEVVVGHQVAGAVVVQGRRSCRVQRVQRSRSGAVEVQSMCRAAVVSMQVMIMQLHLQRCIGGDAEVLRFS